MSTLDITTPARHDILASENHGRYTSFYISDILAERAETPDLTKEKRPPEDKRTQDGLIEGSSKAKDNVEQKRSRLYNEHGSSSITMEPLLKQEVNFSNLKSRSPFLAEQRELLENIFQESKYISSCKRKQLASELNLTERQIKTWFQNRRTKFRKVRGSDGLRRQDTWDAEQSGVSRVLSNIDGGITGLPKDWVLTLYNLLSND